jgi:hypothetical protein
MKLLETSVRTSDVPSEIQTDRLSNMNLDLEGYRIRREGVQNVGKEFHGGIVFPERNRKR